MTHQQSSMHSRRSMSGMPDRMIAKRKWSVHDLLEATELPEKPS
jgi:hypothetical protein